MLWLTDLFLIQLHAVLASPCVCLCVCGFPAKKAYTVCEEMGVEVIAQVRIGAGTNSQTCAVLTSVEFDVHARELRVSLLS